MACPTGRPSRGSEQRSTDSNSKSLGSGIGRDRHSYISITPLRMSLIFAPFSALFLSFRLVSPLRYFCVSLCSYAFVILLRRIYCGHYLLRGSTSIGYCLFFLFCVRSRLFLGFLLLMLSLTSPEFVETCFSAQSCGSSFLPSMYGYQGFVVFWAGHGRVFRLHDMDSTPFRSSKQSFDPSSVFSWRTSPRTSFSSSWRWLLTNPSRGKMLSSRVPCGLFVFLAGKDNEYLRLSIARHVDRYGLRRLWHGNSRTHCTRSTGPEREGVRSEGSVQKIVYARSTCCIVISRPLSLASTLSRAPAVLVSHTISGIWSSVPSCIWVASYFIFVPRRGFSLVKVFVGLFTIFLLSDSHREILPRCGFIKHLFERSADNSSRLRAH